MLNPSEIKILIFVELEPAVSQKILEKSKVVPIIYGQAFNPFKNDLLIISRAFSFSFMIHLGKLDNH